MKHFYKYCDHNRSPLYGRNHTKSQKYNIFVRIAIMIAVLINSAFYEDCNYDHNSQK